MNKYLVGALVIVIIIAGGWYLSAMKKPATGEPIKIGVAIPLTGIAAIVGESEKNGIQLAVDEINQNGGVNGKPLAVVIEDDGTDPTKSVSAVQKLTSVDNVVALIGGTWDFLANAVMPIIDEKQKVMITPSALPDTLEKTSPYFFVTHSPVALNEGVVANFLKKVPGNKIVVISVNNLWGKAHLETFKKAIANAGKSVAKEVIVPDFDNNDVQRELSLIKALSPDAIVMALNFGDTATFLRKKSELGVSGVILGDFHVEDNFNKGNIDAKLLENMQIFVFSDPSSDFVEKYINVYGEKPGTYADTAYDAVYVLKKAIENAGGKTDSDSIIAGMRKITNYKGASGLIDLSKNNYPANKLPLLKEFNGTEFVTVQ